MTIPVFVDQLSNVTLNTSDRVIQSPANINAIVVILRNVANATLTLSFNVNSAIMEVRGLAFPKNSNTMYKFHMI